MDVWTFIGEHTSELSMLASLAMLLVWICYLQLMYNGYRRQRLSAILITRGAGTGIKARCLITNMSQEPIYVISLVAELFTNGESSEVQLTDLRELPEDLGSDPRSAMRQGSLQCGQYLDIGHFDALIDQLVGNCPAITNPADVNEIELTVVALYGPEDLPVGARRCFRIDRSSQNGPRVTPRTVNTLQIHKAGERRNLRKELERFL
ncbi:hypothetical protein U0C82_01505 [Fulvimarina sp. 2208YS6-2-32]|uniref:Uncharacterized protein n=1 Tax=Fulvimarina uroteuthidis TaxID=3098149 RepID=A0ABU5HYH7_9HYPH|nr:hypothetical protein [Fulvimarina sp. 2208YS6-2-32]MDY8107823.1 hypothetical protein [Fulvimarina sp. 2208YS6-2-32]